jgi:integrase
MTITQQLVQNGRQPRFGPPKTGRPRTLSLTGGTVELLRHHHANQSKLKLANRPWYHDYDLVFAREWQHTPRAHDVLGLPLSSSHIADKHFRRLMVRAHVRPIPFHGLRHTSATLLLKAGVPVHVVQERLGHASVTMTLEIYAHALPSMHQDATLKLAGLLGL